jgi:hypothetical protein
MTPIRAAFYVFAAGCILAAGLATPARAAETKYRVTADYINWTPQRGEMDYTYPDTGSVANVEPESDSGYRLGFEIMQGPATYMIGYTDFDSSDEDDRNGSGHGTLIIDDECTVCQSFNYSMGSYEAEYSMLNVGVGYQLRPDSDFGLQFLGGLVFGSIEEEFVALYSDAASVSGNTDVATQTNEVDTLGFSIGMMPSYKLHEKVSIVGKFDYSPMMADVDRSFRYQDGSTGTSGLTTEFNVEISETQIVHKVDLAVGVEVTPVKWLTLEAGYESETWLNDPSFLKITSESGEETIDRGGAGLGFSGPFFRAGFVF